MDAAILRDHFGTKDGILFFKEGRQAISGDGCRKLVVKMREAGVAAPSAVMPRHANRGGAR